MRQYLAPTAPNRDGLLTVEGKDFRYMHNVLRLAGGDMVQVRFPDGTCRNMTVCAVDETAHKIVLQVCAQIADEQQSTSVALDMWLFQFVARSAKMDIIVRQATECGVSVIVPVLGDFSQAGGAEKNFHSERLLRIIKEARQQSGSPVATRIVGAVPLAQAIALWLEHCAGVEEKSFAAVLYERTEETLPLHLALAGKTIARAAVAVGAEGGISPQEIAQLRAGGFVPIHFATNILRCETAALYGVAAVQNAIAEKHVWQCRE